jgi:hypothetical protein
LKRGITPTTKQIVQPTMSGYATDSSNGSNKRVRHASSATAATPPGAAEGAAKQQRSPLDLGLATIDRDTASLQIALRNRIRFFAKTTLKAYSTWLHAKKNYDNEVNNDSFIPTECRIKHKLQPRKRVAPDEGFKSLARECQTVVEDCRRDLKKVEMKCQLMNVQDMRADIAETFCMGIPDIAEVLYAEYDIEGVSKHTAMANLVRHNRDEAISFLNVTDAEFKASYLRIHNLRDFPEPSNPPIITTAPGGVLPLRGGNDTNQVNGGGGEPPPQQQAAPPPTPRQTAIAQAAQMGIPLHSQADITPPAAAAVNANTNPYVNSGRGRGRGGTINPLVTPRTLGFNTAASLLNQEDRLDTTQQHGLFEYDVTLGGVGQNNIGALQQNSQEEVPLLSQPQDNTATNNGNDANDATTNDTVMGDADNEGGGPGTGGNDNNVNADTTTATAAAGADVTHPDLKNVHRQLLQIIEMAFIKPRTIYDRQKHLNDAARRMNEVVKRQTTTAEADRVAEAITQEGNVDPSIVKIVIRDQVETALEQAEKERKKIETNKKQQQQKLQKQQKQQGKTSKERRGPTEGGRLGNTKRNHPPPNLHQDPNLHQQEETQEPPPTATLQTEDPEQMEALPPQGNKGRRALPRKPRKAKRTTDRKGSRTGLWIRPRPLYLHPT